MKKLIFVLTICSFFVATSVLGQNYGNFQANQYGGTANTSVILGPLPGSTPDTRFYINTPNQHGADILVTGNSRTGLSVEASGTSSRALYARAVNSNSHAGYFIGRSYFSQSIALGTTASLASHEKLAVRNGMVTTSGIGNGISLNGSYFGSTPNDFGTQRYGLFMGDGALVNLSTAQNNGHKPIVLSSFYGLAFDVYGGKMVQCQNGAVYIGGNDAGAITRIETLADKSAIDVEYHLHVEKGIRAEKVKVDAKSNWPDFVFEDDYELPSLKTVENYIEKNKHLPNVPSAAEVEKEGVDLGKMDKILLQKIEELTLYTIEQQKQIEVLKKELELLKK